MPALRKAIVFEGVPQVFHCVSRCVRRAYLCGVDALSGRSYEHRRGWVRGRLRELSEAFSIEIYAYAVMSNHLHVVLRTDPDVAAEWSAEEVVLRWRRVFPRFDGDGKLIEPEGRELARLAGDEATVALWRGRLSSVSWLMRCLNEKIARRANWEDKCGGRFWEGRFRCQRLDDAAALLACMVYVDLNPIRAKVAGTLESSDFTSVQDRICAEVGRGVLAEAPKRPNAVQREALAAAAAEAGRDVWQTPLERMRPGDMAATKAGGGDGEDRSLMEGWAMGWSDYLSLVDETGRAIHAGKRGRIGEGVAPALAAVALRRESWLALVKGYGGLFWRVAGNRDALKAAAKAAGQQWFWGSGRKRRVGMAEALE